MTGPATTSRIQYGDTAIEYTLIRSVRRTIGIEVHPDGSVLVKAPEAADLAVVEAFVRRRAPWILRRQREFGGYPTELPPRRYISGETFAYLGRQYRLRVSEGEREAVKLSRGYLDVITPSKRETEHVRGQVEEWLHKQARRVFYERTLALLPRFAPRVLPEPQLVIKPLKTRWGACTHDGKITLNLALIRMPKPCIDYVIAHELCHLVEHNHGNEFYALLGRVMPDWQVRRQQLNEREIR
jgi:predicted metal-dependent hydrolase